MSSVMGCFKGVGAGSVSGLRRMSKGGLLRGHWGAQRLTPTADDGPTLDYTIGFDASVPGTATVLGKVLTGAMIARPGVQ